MTDKQREKRGQECRDIAERIPGSQKRLLLSLKLLTEVAISKELSQEQTTTPLLNGGSTSRCAQAIQDSSYSAKRKSSISASNS